MSITYAAISALHVYPVKSCRGIPLDAARLTPTGFADDRHWMLVRPSGRFVTQRELPRMALIATALCERALLLEARGMERLVVSREQSGESIAVTVWGFAGRGIDCGEQAAHWCTSFLGTPLRLVRFDPGAPRECSAEWTGEVRAVTEFADGFPILVISRASLTELNSRLDVDLPMERFRPNVVLEGVEAYDEDRIHELRADGIAVRMVKPCTRCAITTTEQSTGERDGVEPLATLKSYRFDAGLRGVMFGQNAIIVRGTGATLAVGQKLEVVWK
ncbi:MAG: MOSC N-terminal beta barrel domain-containing protein [Pseudomonadota bacterium]